MAHAGQVIHNPGNKERLVFLRTGQDTNGEDFAFEAYFALGGGVPNPHTHPQQEEQITVVRGTGRFWLNGRAVVLNAGQSVTIPAGTVHRFKNAGDDELYVTAELRPALRTAEMMEQVGILEAQGRFGQNIFQTILQGSILLETYPQEMGMPEPVGTILRLLTPVARLLGYRASYPPLTPATRG
jgi:quercetin dioxygenase-like cupin family protein